MFFSALKEANFSLAFQTEPILFCSPSHCTFFGHAGGCQTHNPVNNFSGRGTPLYGLYRYVRPQRVRFTVYVYRNLTSGVNKGTNSNAGLKKDLDVMVRP